MTEREQLEEAIAALESQRNMLGDAVVDAALAPMREKLAALQAPPKMPSTQQVERGRTGERKLVTVMFADISGFTVLSENMDPESVRDLMNQCFTHLVPCITQYEGTIDKFIGDEIMALFGAPRAHENDAERAIRAALDMMEVLEHFNHEHHINLGLHFGINTGLVLAGDIGAGLRREYSVMGDAVNLAARLEDVSERGQIFVGPHTYRLTSPIFEFETLEPIKLKGRTEAIPAYRVLGLKAKPGKVRGLAMKGISSPLVGREKEREKIQARLQQVRNGQGGIVGVIGEAGLGKSRLVAELRTATTDVLWLEGDTLSFGQTISYWPFQQILRSWSGITEDDDANTMWFKLESHIRKLFGEETVDYLPYLSSLLALEIRGEYAERVKHLDGDAMGKQIFLATRRFFERLARNQPTVLVFEDIHWMDASSEALLEHILPLVETVPLLFIGLSRPERDTATRQLREVWIREYSDRYLEIRLAPLSILDSTQLIRNLLEVENLPANLRELMVKRADGNPFFLEEVIRTLIDTGAVTRDVPSGSWQATAQIESLQIPETIQGVIMARVDRLDDEVKQVLRVASVIGRNFLYRVLKAMSEASQRLDDSLGKLQQTELILEKQATPELEYMFKHALAQEATYESILLQKRRGLHARVAQAIESLFAERLEEFHGLLAYHYAKAEMWDKAQAYLLKAGDQAGRISADAEALNLYQQALAAYARAFGDKWNPLQRAALERKMGEAFFRRSEYPQAMEHLRDALAYLGYQVPMSRWEVRRALLGELLEQVGHRLRPRRLKSTAEPINPNVVDEVVIYRYTGYIDAFTDSERFLCLALRLLNFSERNGYTLGVVMGFEGVGIVLDYLSLFKLAGWYHRSGAEMAEKLQQPYALGPAYAGLTAHELYAGDPAKALAHARRSMQAYLEARDLGELGLPMAYAAWLCSNLGKFDESLAYSQELIRMGRDAGIRALRCWGETIRGDVLQRQGKLNEAIACQRKAQELAKAIPDYLYHIIVGTELALCYLLQGKWQAALAELEACQRFAIAHNVVEPYGRVSMINNLAEVYLFAFEHGNPAEKAIWLDKAAQACETGTKASSGCKLKAPKAFRLQGTYEWLKGKTAIAQRWWQKSLAEAERMDMRYDQGLIHLEMGRRLRERKHVEIAEAIFIKIGAEFELAKARELLGR